MELCSKILLLAAAAALLNVSFVDGQNACPVSSSCSTVDYPFKFKNQTAPNNCTYFDLTCNTTTRATTLSLPLTGGDFSVEYIDYAQRNILLYDPAQCLFPKLMELNNSSLFSSFGRFKAIGYQDYMLYVCPSHSPALESDDVYIIECLSNSTSNITVATLESSSDLMANCTTIGSSLIPTLAQEDGYRLNPDYFLTLTWDAVECKDCEEHNYNWTYRGENNDGKESGKSSNISKAAVYSMPALFLLALSCCSGFFLHLVRILDNKTERDNAATGAGAPQDTTTLPPPPPPPVPSATTNNSTRGLDESRIMACTEIVVLSEESVGNIPSGNKNSTGDACCSICLDSCCSHGDTVRVISKCGHCFHDGCLQQWLAKNGTCPVCRTNCLSDS